MHNAARVLGCTLLCLTGCKPPEPEPTPPEDPIEAHPPPKREKRISVTLQTVDLSTCDKKTTETDPPEQVYSCPNLIAVHMILPGAELGDDATRAAADQMLAGMRAGGTLTITDDRRFSFKVAGKTRAATALRIHHPERGDSVGAYTWVEQDEAAHLLFCMAPGKTFFEGRCDPVWDQLLAGD